MGLLEICSWLTAACTMALALSTVASYSRIPFTHQNKINFDFSLLSQQLKIVVANVSDCLHADMFSLRESVGVNPALIGRKTEAVSLAITATAANSAEFDAELGWKVRKQSARETGHRSHGPWKQNPQLLRLLSSYIKRLKMYTVYLTVCLKGTKTRCSFFCSVKEREKKEKDVWAGLKSSLCFCRNLWL